MVSVWRQSTARARREQVVPMHSNGSRGTLMSYADHSMQRRLKSNTPYQCKGREILLFGDWKVECHVLVYSCKPTSSQCLTKPTSFFYYYCSATRYKQVSRHLIKVFSCDTFDICGFVWFVLTANIRVFVYSEHELMQAAGQRTVFLIQSTF